MKKSVFLAIIGAAALTGCQNEVMKQREYVPAPREDAEAITAPAPAFSDRSGGQTAPETAPETAPKDAPATAPEKRGGAAAQEFPPMTGNFSNAGITDAGAAGAAAGSEYIVKRGDTLGKIAAAHRVKLSALMKANKLSEKDAKKLHVGKKLIIPGGSDAVAKGGKSARNGKGGKGGKRAFGGKESAATLQSGEYIVKSGDTPEKIARRAGVKLSALMEANNFTEESARRLRIGQKIVIPGKDAAAAKSGKAAAKGEKKAPKAETKTAAAPVETKPAAKAADDDLVNEMESSTVKDAKNTAAPAAAPAAVAGTTVVATAPTADTERTSYVQVNEDISVEAFARQHGTTPDVIRQLNPDLTGNTLVKNRIYEVPKK